MRLLVTRPEQDGERTAAALRARGHEALLAPLMRIEAAADGIRHSHKSDRDCARLIQQRGGRGGRIAQQHIGLQTNFTKLAASESLGGFTSSRQLLSGMLMLNSGTSRG